MPGLVDITTSSGKKASVNENAAEDFQNFVTELESKGYTINDIGGYANRPIAGTRTPSKHAFGVAIDINPDDNPVQYPQLLGNRPLKTNLPADIADIADRHNIDWGGNWNKKKDPMHFEHRGTSKVAQANGTNVDDLYNEFKSLSSEAAPSAAKTDVDSLYNEFKTIPDNVGTSQAAPSIQDGSRPPVVTPEVEQSFKDRAGDTTPVNNEKGFARRSLESVSGLKDVPEGAINSALALPAEWRKSLGEHYTGAQKTLGEGVSDIQQNRAFTGTLKTGLGALGMAAAPITAASDVLLKQPGNKVAPGFGDKADFLATSGLPVVPVGAKAVLSAVTPSTRAVDKLVELIGPENLKAAVERLKSNDRLILADVSKPVQDVTGSLASTPGQHQEVLLKKMNERSATANDAVKSSFDDAMGTPKNVAVKLKELQDAATNVGTKVINPVVDKIGPVDITDVIKHIDSKIADSAVGGPTLKSLKAGETPAIPTALAQDKLFNARFRLRGEWKDNPKMFLDAKGAQGAHWRQTEMRREAQSLMDSASGSERHAGYEMMVARNKLVDAIDKASGPIDPVTKMGPYKSGLKQFAEAKDVDAAYHGGSNIFKNSKLTDHPDFLEQWINGASNAEIAAYKEGARLAVDRAMGSVKNGALKGEDLAQIEHNFDKMKLLFGEKETNKLARELRDEKDMAQTHHILFKGSDTARRVLGNKLIEERPNVTIGEAAKRAAPMALLEAASSYATGTPLIATGLALTAGGALKAGNAVGRKIDRATNFQISKMASASGPERDQLIKILESHIPKPKLSLMSKARLALPAIP